MPDVPKLSAGGDGVVRYAGCQTWPLPIRRSLQLLVLVALLPQAGLLAWFWFDDVPGPLRLLLLVTSLAGFPLAGLLVDAMARSIERPLSAFTAVTTAVAAGDGGVRFAAVGAPEIESAGRQLNQMLDLRRSAEAALRTSEERLERALDASGLSLWDYDVVAGTVWLSDSWSVKMGGPRKAMYTRFDSLAARVPAEDRPALQRTLTNALKGGSEVVYSVEHRVVRDDGSWFWNLSEGRVVERNTSGHALRMLGSNRDISERRRASEVRLSLEAQLRESQKMEAIGTLAGGIAHDFNNIVGAILGNLALAREGLAPEHPSWVGIDQAVRAASRGRRVVQQILAFSRRQPQQLTCCTLRPVVEETLALMRVVLPAGVLLEPLLADEPLQVQADSTQLQQVLMNLCTNAWHALSGERGRISVGLAREAPDPIDTDAGPCALLWVSDDGCGMDDATRPRIFEPFFTTKSPGKGTGLGLAVVHGIVAAHGGSIRVESAPGRGSRFEVRLRLLDAAAPLLASATAAPMSAHPTRPAAGPLRVLVIDDDEVMLLLLDRLLQRDGYLTTACLDPHQALALFEAEPDAFAAVVSDHDMPALSGLDVARAVAMLRPGLPVIVSSGFVDVSLAARAREAGVADLVQKESLYDALGPALARALGQPG